MIPKIVLRVSVIRAAISRKMIGEEAGNRLREEGHGE